MSYPRHSYHTSNINDIVLPYLRVEAIWINFGYQFIMVLLEIPELIKRRQSYPMFKSSVTEFYLSQY